MGKRSAALIGIVIGLTVMGVRAQEPARFEVRYPGVPLRAAPSVLAARGGVLEQGASYRMVARTGDGAWVAVDERGATGWVASGFGAVSGAAPILTPTISYGLPPVVAARLPAWIHIDAQSRAMFARAMRSGRDGRMFTVAGDSNSAWPHSFGRILTGEYDLRNDVVERTAAARFDAGFVRVSISVGGGFGTADMLRSDSRCGAGETLLACELRLSNAAVLFVQLGTGDKYTWREFDANLRRVVQTALDRSVVPVLVTKADDLESILGGGPEDHINSRIRAVAAELDLPWIDFHAAARTLPAVPNPDLPKRPFTQFGLHDEWGYYFHLTEQGEDLRLKCTLLALGALASRE